MLPSNGQLMITPSKLLFKNVAASYLLIARSFQVSKYDALVYYPYYDL